MKENLKRFAEENRNFTALASAFILVNLFVVISIWKKPLIWDAAIYTAMGKSLFSLGQHGLWEMFRPPLLPVISGIQWFLGIPALGYSRLISLLISTGVLAALYRFSSDIMDKTKGTIITGVLASTATFAYYTPEFLTGIPASGLVIISLYLAWNQRFLPAGIVGGMAFLMRFPAALIGPAVVAYLAIRFYRQRDFRKFFTHSAIYTSGFMLLAIPYFVINAYLYGNPLAPILRGVAVPASNPDTYIVGAYYLIEAVKVNPLHLLSIPGAYLLYKERRRAFELIVPAFILYYGFFTVFPHKEARFMLLFLPLLSIFTGYGSWRLLEMLRDRFDVITETLPKKIGIEEISVILLIIGIAVTGGITYSIMTPVNENSAEYYANHSDLEGTVAANDATIMAYGDFSYHALPPSELEGAYDAVDEEAEYLSLNSCAWYCTPQIENCESKIDDLARDAEQRYEKKFELNTSSCSYRIYEVGDQN